MTQDFRRHVQRRPFFVAISYCQSTQHFSAYARTKDLGADSRACLWRVRMVDRVLASTNDLHLSEKDALVKFEFLGHCLTLSYHWELSRLALDADSRLLVFNIFKDSMATGLHVVHHLHFYFLLLNERLCNHFG